MITITKDRINSFEAALRFIESVFTAIKAVKRVSYGLSPTDLDSSALKNIDVPHVFIRSASVMQTDSLQSSMCVYKFDVQIFAQTTRGDEKSVRNAFTLLEAIMRTFFIFCKYHAPSIVLTDTVEAIYSHDATTSYFACVDFEVEIAGTFDYSACYNDALFDIDNVSF